MKLLTFSLILLAGCAGRNHFEAADVCSPTALKFVKQARDRDRAPLMTEALRRELEASKQSMQKCYDDFYARTGQDEFKTCLVVGVDVTGMLDFYSFSAREIQSDRQFVQCAVNVTKTIQFWRYGTNYTLIQSYNFHSN